MHLRGINRRLNISLGNLRYHLAYLEKKGMVTSKSNGYRKVYFSARDVLFRDKNVLALLRQERPRKILLYLMLHPEATFEEIRKEIKVSKSTLSFHLKKLTANNIIVGKKKERYNVYLIPDAERIAELLITYQSTFVDKAVDKVVKVWL